MTLSEQLNFEWSRTLTLAAVGLCYSGPINHLWFQSLERLIRIQHQAGAALSKLFIDQLFFAPVAISGYFVTRGLFEGKSLADIQKRLQNKLIDATLAAWQFWPVVNLISFSVVPVMYRVLFGNISAIFWNARLSSISSQRLDDVATRRVENPSEFVALNISEDNMNRMVRQKLRIFLNQDPIGLEEEWVQQSRIPLPTLGRALKHWWTNVVCSRCCKFEIEAMSAAELYARALVCHCQQCRAMRL
jgi:protein Mpv17